jgi:hypothetical protein
MKMMEREQYTQQCGLVVCVMHIFKGWWLPDSAHKVRLTVVNNMLRSKCRCFIAHLPHQAGQAHGRKPDVKVNSNSPV